MRGSIYTVCLKSGDANDARPGELAGAMPGLPNDSSGVVHRDRDAVGHQGGGRMSAQHSSGLPHLRYSILHGGEQNSNRRRHSQHSSLQNVNQE